MKPVPVTIPSKCRNCGKNLKVRNWWTCLGEYFCTEDCLEDFYDCESDNELDRE